MSPSSQNSLPTNRLSPHISTQVVSVNAVLFVQLKPISIVQVAEQPSPGVVLLSSHCSLDVIKLSPQTSTQVDGFESSPPVQLHPLTFPVHVLFHLLVSN